MNIFNILNFTISFTIKYVWYVLPVVLYIGIEIKRKLLGKESLAILFQGWCRFILKEARRWADNHKGAE